jgi:hypothetical protein
VDRPQRAAQFAANLGVERTERLIEQQDFRIACQRPGERDPLALAARQLRRIAITKPRQLYEFEQFGDARGDLGLFRALLRRQHVEPEGDILGHRHVAEQGILLEHEADAAPLHRQVGNIFSAEADMPPIGMFEPRDDPQQGGLARTRWAQQRHELAFGQIDADPFERGEIAEAAGDVVNRDGHVVSVLKLRGHRRDAIQDRI